jgi:hypothetical protein
VIAGWHTALGFALTGEERELPATELPDPDVLLAALAAQGWTSERLAAHARETVEAERPWPHAVPPRLRAGCGAAQFHAALNRARAALDLVVLETRAPSTRRHLNADEERLLREVPPHHGS